jgi:hypothetical protein
MNYTLATGSSVHQTVSLIMAAKPLDIIVGQPTTDTINTMIEQMAQMIAPVKTTAWGGHHGSLALVLDDADYSSITKAKITSTKPVTQPDAINKGITATSTPLEILTFQEEIKKLQKEFDLQEAVTNISMQCIIDSVEEQYIKELNKEYFGYANNTIKSVLHHLQTNWCKVMTRERTEATEAFYQVWVPNMTHIITFGCQLIKQQKKCKAISVIISDETKTLHFVGQMYKSDYFTKEQMTKYDILPDANKVWDKTLAHPQSFSPYAKPMVMTGQQTADSRAQHTSVTTHPLTASSQPTPRVTSRATSTLRASRNHSRLLGNNTLRTQPRAHPYHWPLIPSRFSKPNSQNNASRYWKSWHRMPNSLQHSPRVAAATAKAAAATMVIGTKPHGRRKKLCPNCIKEVVHNPADCFTLEANKAKCLKGWGTKRKN